MTAFAYLKDKIMVLLLNGISLFFLSLYLLATANSSVTVLLISLIWVVVLVVYLYIDYRGRKKYFDQIEELMENLDQPYLVQEFLGNSWRLSDQLYKDILYRSNKAVIEQIYQLEDSQKEYREFIEGWIHEVKLPITGMRLASHNSKQAEDRRIEAYLTEMENLVEQALFYARSDQVYKDYLVVETDLKQVILKLVGKNKYLLIQNQMNVQIEFDEISIMTDRKWLEYILTQILNNAIKYKKSDSGEIIFRAEPAGNSTRLTIRDAGIGIPPDEIGRIFEKGFTGSNGRERERSTGIGLYLCRKLCRKLEIQIGAESIPDKYTEIYFIFPKNSYLSKL